MAITATTIHGRLKRTLSTAELKQARETGSAGDEQRFAILERFKTLIDAMLTDVADQDFSTIFKVRDAGSKLTATTLAPMLQEIVAMIEAQALGIRWKKARLATAAALPACTYANGSSGVGATLTGNANGALTVDGQAVAVGNIVLVKNQVAQAQNGPYVVTVAGSGGAAFVLTRVGDADAAAELVGGLTYTVDEGTDNVDTVWLCTTDGAVTVGTTAITFIPLPGVGGLVAGAGLTKTGVTIDVVANGDGSIVVNANDLQVGVLATDGQHGNRGGGGLHANAIAGGAAGFMSGADKTALDGLTTGAAKAVRDNSFPANTKRVILQRDADGATYSETVFHSAASTPSTGDNTAAGYPDGSFWFDTSSAALWFKVMEAGGMASWRRCASRAFRQNLADATANIDITSMSWDATVFKGVRLKGFLAMGNTHRRMFELFVLFEAATPGNSTVTVIDATNLGDVDTTFALVTGGGSVMKLQATTGATGTARTLDLYIDEVYA